MKAKNKSGLWALLLFPSFWLSPCPRSEAQTALTGASPSLTQAAPPDKADAANLLNALYADFDAPDLTAPTLLGISTSQVTKPANIKAFAASLLGAGASFPQVGKGVGIEIAPVQFLPHLVSSTATPFTSSLESYQQYSHQLARSFSLSGAQTSTDSSARAAFGGAVLLLDKTDPLLDNAYLLTVAQKLRDLKERAALTALYDFNATTRNNRFLVSNRAGFFPNNNGYYNGPPDQTSVANARRRFGAFFSLLGNGLGQLPSLTPSSPLPTSADFNTTQDGLLAAVNTRIDAATGDFDQDQRTAIKQEAQEEVDRVKTAFADFATKAHDFYSATNVVVKAEREAFEKRQWNAPVVQLGGGWTWASTDKRYGTLVRQSAGFFVRAAFRPHDKVSKPDELKGFSRFAYQHMQVVAELRYNSYSPSSMLKRPALTLPDSLNQRVWYGVRLLLGGANFRLSGEGSIQWLKYSQTAQDAAQKVTKTLPGTILSATIGTEVRLADKLWLEAAIGSTKPAGQAARLLTLGSLKYALRNSQRFKTN